MSKNIVHELIKSLSIREKVYFKRFATSYSENKNKNYLLLYNALEKQSIYDKNTLFSQIDNNSIKKHLSSELNYLFNQILKSLANYNFDINPVNKLQKSIIFIEILIAKGFKDKAYKILLKTKSFAYKIEEFTTILKLIQQEEEILFKEGILNFTNQLGKLQKERENINNKIKNLNELRLLREEARELQYTHGFISDVSLFPQLFALPILDEKNLVLSHKALEHWYYIREFRYYITRQYSKGLNASNEYLEFMESHPQLFKNAKLLSTISNNLLFASYSYKEDAFFKTLPKLEALENDNELDIIYIKYIKYVRILDFYFKIKNFIKLKESLTEAELYLESNFIKMGTTQVNFTKLIFVKSYIILNDFEKANYWVNSWLNSGILKTTLVYARVFLILIHFKLGYNELIINELNSAKKVLKNHSCWNDLTIILFDFFKKVAKQPEMLINHLNQLTDSLFIIKSDGTKNHYFEYFDFYDYFNNMKHEFLNANDKIYKN